MDKKYLRKYFIMGSQNCTRSPGEILEEALQSGISAFQYREKGSHSLMGEQKLLLGQKLRELCRSYGVPFIVNDSIDLALQLDADGIHVGQNDVGVSAIREKYPQLLIGLSISNSLELEQSPIDLVDYIGAGPIFATKSKEDAKKPVGTQWITTLRELHPSLPIVGIGGITTDNAEEVITAGADGVAVISVITKANNIPYVIQHL